MLTYFDCYLVWILDTGSLCSFGGCPGNHSVDKVGLEITEVHLHLQGKCQLWPADFMSLSAYFELPKHIYNHYFKYFVSYFVSRASSTWLIYWDWTFIETAGFVGFLLLALCL